MLPRKQSIFHLGEEGSAIHHRVCIVGAAMTSGVRRVRERERERERLVVGLHIVLVRHQHHHHHERHAHAAHIVLKQMVRPRTAVSCSFLVACYLCKRELSANKDVYMYRGDQGFCSEECRCQQILVDEAREREAAVISKERQRRGQQARHHSPHHTPIGGSRPPMTTLAVA